MKTRKQLIEEYEKKGYIIGNAEDIKSDVYVNNINFENILILKRNNGWFFLIDMCPRHKGDLEDIDLNEYSKYRRTKKWKTLSSLVKEKAGNKCVFCGSEKKLVAHHHNYINLYNETEKDLICVCNICHMKIHRGCYCMREDVQCKCCEYSKNNYKVLYEFLSSQVL